MTTVRFRNPEVRMSDALAAAQAAVREPAVTLVELLGLLGEQGLLVFCGVLAAPFLLPITVPGMSTVLGLPMLLIGFAVMMSRVPWLPARLLNRSLPAATVQNVLKRVRGWAERFEHLVRPRLLGLTDGRAVNALNGALVIVAVVLMMAPLPFVPFVNSLPALAIILLCFGMAERDGVVILAVVLLMAPLPLVPFVNTLPALAVILLCFGMAERDGVVILLGYLTTLVSTVYVGGIAVFVLYAGMHYQQAFEMVRGWFSSF